MVSTGQLLRLQEHLESLVVDGSGTGLTAPQRIVLKILTDIRLADVTALGQSHDTNESHRRPHLDGILQKWLEDLRMLSDVISRMYLVHISESRQLGFQLGSGG